MYPSRGQHSYRDRAASPPRENKSRPHGETLPARHPCLQDADFSSGSHICCGSERMSWMPYCPTVQKRLRCVTTQRRPCLHSLQHTNSCLENGLLIIMPPMSVRSRSSPPQHLRSLSHLSSSRSELLLHVEPPHSSSLARVFLGAVFQGLQRTSLLSLWTKATIKGQQEARAGPHPTYRWEMCLLIGQVILGGEWMKFLTVSK